MIEQSGIPFWHWIFSILKCCFYDAVHRMIVFLWDIQMFRSFLFFFLQFSAEFLFHRHNRFLCECMLTQEFFYKRYANINGRINVLKNAFIRYLKSQTNIRYTIGMSFRWALLAACIYAIEMYCAVVFFFFSILHTQAL